MDWNIPCYHTRKRYRIIYVDQFGHAYIDDYGQTFLGIIFMMFLALFIKIGTSDAIRKFKGFQERKERMKEAEMEMAKI